MMQELSRKIKELVGLLFAALVLASCSAEQKIARAAQREVTGTAALRTAHVGISIYEPASGKYLFSYQGDKYFVPASNTKIPTCYAAMKYLGDSLAGLRYYLTDSVIILLPAADPSFMMEEFRRQPVLEFLRNASKPLAWGGQEKIRNPLGSGWSWNDYLESYMPERSVFPLHGNVVTFSITTQGSIGSVPSFFARRLQQAPPADHNFYIFRNWGADNNFYTRPGSRFSSQTIPFATAETNIILEDILGKKVGRIGALPAQSADKIPYTIYSQPTDSLLRPMMQRSDNFFAEQSLLMVSNELLGTISDALIIDTLLKTDLKDLPQRPRWVDGSGLSRYNLFTPQDMVYILNRMRVEFGMQRIQGIFPTGGQGTLSGYYSTERGYIYAKTGTLSGVVALSGFLYTKKGKQLIFSVLVNNHQASAAEVRRAVEKFIRGIRDRY